MSKNDQSPWFVNEGAQLFKRIRKPTIIEENDGQHELKHYKFEHQIEEKAISSVRKKRLIKNPIWVKYEITKIEEEEKEKQMLKEQSEKEIEREASENWGSWLYGIFFKK
jgi:hypothetical protein